MSANYLLPVLAKRVVYSPDSGQFVWLPKEGDAINARRWNAAHSGKEAGSLDVDGYRVITLRVDGVARSVKAARLAWYMYHGCVPIGQLDHVNGIRDDNRMCNLRDVSASINQRNRKHDARNTSGHVGVVWDEKSGLWKAQGNLLGKPYVLGKRSSKHAAAALVKEFRAKHGFTTRAYDGACIH